MEENSISIHSVVLYNTDSEMVSNQSFPLLSHGPGGQADPFVLTGLPPGEEMTMHVTVANHLGNSKTLIFEVIKKGSLHLIITA